MTTIKTAAAAVPTNKAAVAAPAAEAPKPVAGAAAADPKAAATTDTKDKNDVKSTGESSSIEAPKIAGGSFSSVGDPHETTGDGMKFDNMQTGNFVKLRAKSGDFELQTRQDPWDRNPQATVNTAAAVKVNAQGDKVAYDANTGALTFNGKPVTVTADKPFEIPGGGRIEASQDGYKVVSAKGDAVNIMDRGTYLDVTGEVSADRRDGDVTGSLGRMDSDTDWSNDLVGRDGKDIKDVNAFIEEWRVKPEEDLIGDVKPAEGGEDEAPVGDEAKPVEGAEGEQPADDAAPAEGEAPVEGAEGEEPVKAAGDDAAEAEAKPDLEALLAQLKELLTGGDPAAPKVGGDQAAQIAEMLRKLLAEDEEGANKALDKKGAEAAAANVPAAGFDKISALLKQILEMLTQEDKVPVAA